MNEVIGYVDTRAAEVATTAIASDVAQVHQDMLDADADAQAAAASAAAAARTLANAVKKTGESSQNIAGDIAISGTTSLVNVAVSDSIEVPIPLNDANAATKKYVDDADALKLNITAIGNYAVLLTGNQNSIAGDKTFKGKIINSRYKDNGYIEIDDTFFNNKAAPNFEIFLNICDGNGMRIGALGIRQNNNSTRELRVLLLNSDNTTYKNITLATSD